MEKRILFLCPKQVEMCGGDFLKKKIKIFKSSKRLSIKKLLRKTFAQLWEKRKSWPMIMLQRSLPPNLKRVTMINGKKLNLQML